MKFGTLTKARIILKSIIFLPHFFLYWLNPNKDVIDSDIKAWGKYRDYIDTSRLSRSQLLLLVLQPEFRLQFAWRLEKLAYCLPYLGGGALYAHSEIAITSEKALCLCTARALTSIMLPVSETTVPCFTM